MSDNVSGNDLNNEIWDIVVNMITAAHDVNLVTYRDAIERMRQYMEPEGHVFGRIFFYLLWRAAFDYLQRDPEVADVPALADRSWPNFSKMMKADRTVIENLIDDVVSNRAVGKGPRGTDFTVVAPAVIGTLIGDPTKDLLPLRTVLYDWYNRNYA